MASKVEQYKLAMAENLLTDVIQFGEFEKHRNRVRKFMLDLQSCYSFREDDLYHPKISAKAEITDCYKNIRKASMREHIDYFVMLHDEPKYTADEKEFADLLATVDFNKGLYGTSKREFYLMAKYVMLTDGLLEDASSPHFMNSGEKVRLDKTETEIKNILEELNTSGRDYYGERLKEHDFVNADDEKIQERFKKMGGYFKYYPATKDSPPEYVYNEAQYESAEMYQVISEQEENISYNRSLIEKEMARMGADINKSAEYVGAVDLLDDRVFLEESVVDRKRAEKICRREKNTNFPMKERLPYLEILMTTNAVYDKMKEMSLYNDRTLLFASDTEKINTVINEVVKKEKNDMKFSIKDNVLRVNWQYDYGKRRQVSIPFDGTLTGFIKSCETSDKRDKCYYWKNESGNFLDNIVSIAKNVDKCKDFIRAGVFNIHTLASSYMKNEGSKFVPSIAETMKKLSNCKVEDAVNGKNEEWNKQTAALLHSYAWRLKDGMERVGREHKDTLWYRPVAAKRVLDAYRVMTEVMAKEIKIEQGKGKELKK